VHLRTPSPTLEPDDAFVARLSALAAAGAPAERRSPVTTWRVALVAAGVAAVLVGVAWLTGLSTNGSPEPAPGPATRPSAPASTDPSAGRSPNTSTSHSAPAQPGSAPIGVGSTATGGTHTPAPPTRGQDAPDNQDQLQQPQSAPGEQAGSSGPDQHAGDHPNEHATTKHPNEHATTKSNRGRPQDGDQPSRGPRSEGGNSHR
jgi:hypothetical protein